MVSIYKYIKWPHYQSEKYFQKKGNEGKKVDENGNLLKSNKKSNVTSNWKVKIKFYILHVVTSYFSTFISIGLYSTLKDQGHLED